MSEHTLPVPMAQLTNGVVRVVGPGGRTTGAGFVVSTGLVVTCSHVIQSCGSQHNAPPAEPVSVVFATSGEVRQARVEPGYWRDCAHGDVAFLRIDGLLPTGVCPLVLGPAAGTRGHRFRTFDYPASGPASGMYGYGQLGDQVNDGGVELVQITGASQVTREFSGAPVFDETARRVVGMVNAITRPDVFGRGDRTAFVIPTETLRAVCAELGPGAK